MPIEDNRLYYFIKKKKKIFTEKHRIYVEQLIG